MNVWLQLNPCAVSSKARCTEHQWRTSSLIHPWHLQLGLSGHLTCSNARGMIPKHGEQDSVSTWGHVSQLSLKSALWINDAFRFRFPSSYASLNSHFERLILGLWKPLTGGSKRLRRAPKTGRKHGSIKAEQVLEVRTRLRQPTFWAFLPRASI